MIDVNKTLTGNDGFVQVDNIVFTMYPLLDGFSIETAGLYAYLRTWKQNNPEHKLYKCVWLTQEDISAQAGIGRHKLERNIDVLESYGLVTVHELKWPPQKKIYEIQEPLTEAEFRTKYPKEMENLERKMRNAKIIVEMDRAQFKKKHEEWKQSSCEF